MKDKNLLKTGLAGSLIAMICCFTPVLVVALAAFGLSAWLAWLDYVLIPSLLLFMAIAAFAFIRMGRKWANPDVESRP